MTISTPPPAPAEPQPQQEEEEVLVPHQELPNGTQPMEVCSANAFNRALCLCFVVIQDPVGTVVPAEPAATVENQPTEDTPISRFTWTIDNLSRVNTKKLYSETFVVGGYKWRVLIFPRGNNVEFLSMYLDVADSAVLPYGWTRYAQFSLSVVNQIHNKFTIRKETQHQFSARESDWGFTSFMPLSELYNPSRGYLVNDTCVIEAEVAVCKVVDYWSYDSKKETGYVGLKNQGATCYMNSLLQTLYHIPYFRKAVYHMPTTENDMPSGSIPLALQSLFYKLQYNDSSVSTKELTKSFGWDMHDSFMQHDVQELNRVLSEKLEDKMKLDVKGCQDVYASFDKYVEVERLEGDNKYHAEQHGLQDAKKGVLFIDFPPVLQLQLKRFEYDFMRDTMVKINDRYEFPLQLDLDRDDGKYLSPDADRNVRNLYTLHSGGVHGGHYYAFIRPTLSDQWFKFDDERVTKEDAKRALEEQYGGEEELPQTNPGLNNTPFKFTKYSNAYMLVYIRESDKDKIICNVDEKDIAEHLRIRLEKDREEKERRKKEKAEAHLYTIIKEEVAKELGIPTQFQRFWLWAKRQNHTYRPNRPLTPQEEALTVGQLKEAANKAHNAELKLFLEVELGLDLKPLALPDKTRDDILLFFKLYDPEKEQLRYVGRLFVKASGRPQDILPKLRKMAGFLQDDDVELYEEIKFEPNVMCEYIDNRIIFRSCQLEDGDIVCFQKSPKPDTADQFRYPDVPSFLVYIRNRQVVHFRSLEKPKEDDFCLEMSKIFTYDEVVEKVAQQLGVDDPSKIRLTSHNCYSQQPKPQPIKYRGVERLLDMLIHYNQTSDILYYEVLDIPLPELQALKTLKVTYHHATKDEVSVHSIRLPKNSTVGDVLSDIKSKVDLSHPDAELRLLEVFYHKIYKVIFAPSEKIENINDQYWTLRAEEVPEEEKNLGPFDRLIHVYHFTKDTQNQTQVQNFGEPFFMVIREDETLSSIKERLQKKLKVSDEDFSKWKFAYISLGRPDYFEDSDTVATRFQRNMYGAWEQYLGLEHPDTAPRKAHSANQLLLGAELLMMLFLYIIVVSCTSPVLVDGHTGEKTHCIRQIMPPHTCGTTTDTSRINITWLAKEYEDEIRSDPTINIIALIDAVHRRFGIEISRHMAYRAKNKALEAVEGDKDRQYLRIRDYLQTVMEKNPGSRCHGLMDVFLRWVMEHKCLPPQLEMAIIILSARIRCRWNGRYCYMVMVSQSTQVCTRWYCRQKGLLAAVHLVFPQSSHRYCLRHIYANFQSAGYKGGDLKKLVDAAAYAFDKCDFDVAMEELKKQDKDAWEWMCNILPKHWARHALDTHCKTDLVVNNIGEVFNNYILKVRDKAIVTMIDSIRTKLMPRYASRRGGVEHVHWEITPTYVERLEWEKRNARWCTVTVRRLPDEASAPLRAVVTPQASPQPVAPRPAPSRAFAPTLAPPRAAAHSSQESTVIGRSSSASGSRLGMRQYEDNRLFSYFTPGLGYQPRQE
ncbi:Ubiquitin carboxyl-terminal hydrolase 12 [Triticum urartu]|uniref:ubiquitinyl hydrolase 1 n=2 Tax=Triticinae TaxID=1648030 RepID=M7YX76_TRIUA|nr:Ubiquitin carboxyl-terminal hydrolase 12 [Triticum urartu]